MKFLTILGMLALTATTAFAQDLSREEIRRAPVPGSDSMEVVVSKLSVAPGATIPMHTHPGDEHAVVITAAKAQAPNGQVIEFPVGATLYFPEGQVHGGLTNIGDVPMVAITTHVVRIGEPLTQMAN
ncbi:Cupin domain protein [Pelagimonas phthalicica]|uniref:Cupin domain protein n=1 Tax=Pelagimonas phthalicica TaxID=1037362 RepID=A0A238J5K7_9RHOB|nr:cupin domain-containing protein [Pelagimonas phthalicica]TDS95487.1 Cupin domain-containing protein [Pelagimonas phthalicica]SMX25990.1 Cupin domain protein [Pelagimonas phthalicica]